MSGNGAASSDHESGFATPGDADGFHTVLSRTARKNARGSKPTPGGVITVLPPIQEPPVTVLDTIDPLTLVTHMLGRVENDQLVDTATSLFQQLQFTIQNVASGRGVTCLEGFSSQE